ncbi:chemotaxis protein CheW [Candidatus Margulisiibacteriota bacterium]
MGHLLVFQCGKEEFGLPIEETREVRRMTNIISVPHAPEFVEGLIRLRGRTVAMIDLNKRLGIKAKERTAQSRFIVARARGVIVGLTVDNVEEVLEISEKDIEPAPSIVLPINDGYIRNVVEFEERLILILNLDEILSKEEAKKIHELKNENHSPD